MSAQALLRSAGSGGVGVGVSNTSLGVGLLELCLSKRSTVEILN